MSANSEAANSQPLEHKGPQASPDDQPLHLKYNLRSHDQFMALVAESKARVKALSPEELRARVCGPVRGVSVNRAMDILDELEADDEAAESETEDNQDGQDGQDKTAPEAEGAQDEQEKAVEEKQESEGLSASKS